MLSEQAHVSEEHPSQVPHTAGPPKSIIHDDKGQNSCFILFNLTPELGVVPLSVRERMPHHLGSLRRQRKGDTLAVERSVALSQHLSPT